MDQKALPRLLRRPEVLAIVGCSASTLRRIPDFPRPVNIGLSAIAWREDEIRAWIERRTVARDGRAA